jgi:DNA-directed RNA polymerase subunit omega
MLVSWFSGRVFPKFRVKSDWSVPALASGAGTHMIEALKSDEIVNKVGGRFRLCALIQRRLVQLMEGARPLVDRNGRSDLEIAIEEIVQGKISYEFDQTSDFDMNKINPNYRAHASV